MHFIMCVQSACGYFKMETNQSKPIYIFKCNSTSPKQTCFFSKGFYAILKQLKCEMWLFFFFYFSTKLSLGPFGLPITPCMSHNLVICCQFVSPVLCVFHYQQTCFQCFFVKGLFLSFLVSVVFMCVMSECLLLCPVCLNLIYAPCSRPQCLCSQSKFCFCLILFKKL